MSLKGVYKNKLDNDIRIIIERDYKKKDAVDFFYFMCKYTGGGTIDKVKLLNEWDKVN